MIRLLFPVPVSNTKLERMFSKLKCVKINFCCSLGVQCLQNILRIMEEGSSSETYKVVLLPFKINFFNESPLKMTKKGFLFHLKSSFRSQDNYIFVLTFWSFKRKGLTGNIRLISRNSAFFPVKIVLLCTLSFISFCYANDFSEKNDCGVGKSIL